MQPLRRSLHVGERIRVLVVDDSVVMRRLLSRIVEADETMELVGAARNGVDALQKIAQLHPHLVTLDVEMPELDGIGALREIVKLHRDVRVIMLSSLTIEGAHTTVEALLGGASDYIAKPQGGDVANAFDGLAHELTTKIRQLFFFEQAVRPMPAPPQKTRVPMFSVLGPEIFAIGISTGGPSALAEVLPTIPASFPLPIAIVQHMPPYFTRLLAERLMKSCAIRVVECVDGMEAEAGCAVIAPGNFHMRLVRSGLTLRYKLSQEEPENSCRPAVDVLFRSIAETCKERAIAAVMTGMGQDGLAGAQLLKDRGAWLLAQDRASSTVWGMPGAIVDAALADAVLPLSMIIPEVLRRAGCR
jgi:two-component system, chemotaxis family, protein-glutamate methylesterase/glutaminase